jgi:uncharacterized protein YbjQ (UPF0145 family)
MPAVLVVTTDVVPGYQVTSVIGQVVGSVARLSNAFTEGIRTMDGQLNPHRGHDLAQWRTDAVNAMVEEARKKGANAVIGTRFDNRLISTAWAEICAYGTAVRVDPQDRPRENGPAPVQPPRADSPVVPPAKESSPSEVAASPPGAVASPPGAVASPSERAAESGREVEPERGVEAGPEVEASATGWPEEPEPAAQAPSKPEAEVDAAQRDEPDRPQHDRPQRDRPQRDRPQRNRSQRDRPQRDRPQRDQRRRDLSDEDRSERVGPERLRAEEPDPDWPDTPTDPTLRMPD